MDVSEESRENDALGATTSARARVSACTSVRPLRLMVVCLCVL